ncbi:conserved hypothetical protein [Histoplasma capsulatum G186AR]|uniref:FAD/NAD(P)-binding domain-containing protein n=2 Tax=Ajellomyces capsulatus TaxID=5037 RepID=C0P0U1_AJECG|nr:uncharacterized protein HCBG_09021 [Histoplasma capsulatum G186AR]EEH02741.1 conserved hypothetical protein [Histoplasma capsulatum G186AR]KAG5287308.1 hypothetical protein I7I52_11036 [Histoplasma capsulatum]QSS70881.1 hypothetical protein I7I50_12660 [Histoplasma capsulatum G186AR]
MATKYEKRVRAPVAELPSYIPTVPVLENEQSLNAAGEAQAFLQSFSRAVGKQDWEAFGSLFCDGCFWKDSLTLTFDKRTLSGRDKIVAAWKTLSETRKPTVFTSKQEYGLGIEPKFERLSPTLASLDVPFCFTTDNPKSNNIGLVKLIPEGGQWKIWVLSTDVVSLTEHPFETLPRKTPSSVPASQRGKAQAQGLPHLQGVLDVVVIGASCSGLANTIMLDSIGVNVAAFETYPVACGNWSGNGKDYVTIHHNKLMVALPGFPVPEDYPEYLPGRDFTRYASSAVEALKLPLFCGVKVVRNNWDETAGLWKVVIQDVETKEEETVEAKNIVISTGFLISPENPGFPNISDRNLFQGVVQHAAEYGTAEQYVGKDVVVVGSGNSAHDIARSLVHGHAKSVTMLQRSPTILSSHEAIKPIIEARYQGNMPVATADFLQQSLPTGIARDVSRGMISMVMKSQPDLLARLESKGYMLKKDACMVTLVYEHRGHATYMDQLRTFDLVFEDKIKIARGDARKFVPDGIVAFDKDQGKEVVLKADGVVLATGYRDVDLPDRYAQTGFLDSRSAAMIENVSEAGVDVEGEMPGYFTHSGHPHLYFGGYAIINNRWVSRLTAIQVMADIAGKFPSRYARE